MVSDSSEGESEDHRMDVPPPQACAASECNYNTPIGVPTWELVAQMLTAHTQAAHPPPAPAAAPAVAGGPTGKLDKRPRPESNIDMSEHNFKLFMNEWNLYKQA